MIKLSNVKKSFNIDGELVTILNIPDFVFSEGKLYLLKGESGQGKTTLLNLLSGLTLPDEGSIVVDDNEISAMSEVERDKYRAGEVGYIFQDFNLFDGFSALENVLVPLTIVSRGKVKDNIETATNILSQVGLSERINAIATKLSGGEKQRVALARAIVNKPSLILADEPCGNLDKRNGQKIMELIVRFARENGSTLIVVSHDLSYAPLFDEIVDITDISKEN